jgi:hypothetical protein
MSSALQTRQLGIEAMFAGNHLHSLYSASPAASTEKIYPVYELLTVEAGIPDTADYTSQADEIQTYLSDLFINSIVSDTSTTTEHIASSLNPLFYFSNQRSSKVIARSFEKIVGLHRPEASSSPFEFLATIRSDDKQFLQEVENIRSDVTLNFAAQLADRLQDLLEAYKEDSGDKALSVYSLYSLIQFIKSDNRLKRPSLSATPDGNLYAQWRNADRSCIFSVHFLSDETAKFFISQPNAKHPSRRNVLSGSTTVDLLLSQVAPLGIMRWASDNG